MIAGFFGITWLAFGNVWFFPLILVLIIFAWVRVWRIARVSKLLVSARWRKQLLVNVSVLKTFLKALCTTLGLVCLFIILLRPAVTKEEQIVSQEGRDVFIALDVSRSMLATDCKPNRLECAKKKVRELLSSLGCERVGLILFSGSAFVQCPLTTDYAAFYMFLDQVDVETISSGTTAMDAPIKKAIEAFSENPDKKTKLMVIFTDGEDFSSNLAKVKSDASSVGLKIFTVGVGSPEGAPIPLYNERGMQIGHQLDKRGKVVISRLNEGILSALARDCGGIYLRSQQDQSDIRLLTSRIEKFEKDKFDDKKLDRYREIYYYFVWIAFAFLACGLVL